MQENREDIKEALYAISFSGQPAVTITKADEWLPPEGNQKWIPIFALLGIAILAVALFVVATEEN